MSARLPTGGSSVEIWVAPRGASYFALIVTFWNTGNSETLKLHFLILQWEINGYLPFNVGENSNKSTLWWKVTFNYK